MKKTVILIITMLLMAAFSVNAFAWGDYEVFDFSKCMEGYRINANTCSSNSSASSSEVLTIRNNWTVSRNPENNCDSDDPDNEAGASNWSPWNAESVIVLEEDDYGEEILVAKLAAPQYLVSQYVDHFTSGDSLTFEIKKDEVNGFSGVVLNYGTSDLLDVGVRTTLKTDYFFTEYPAKNGAGASYVMATGYGFTFLPDSNTAVRLFVRCINDGELDVIYYDIDLGVDLTTNYYTYGFYYTGDKTVFAFGEALDNDIFYGQGSLSACPYPEDEVIPCKAAAVINFSNPGKVSEKIDGQSLTQEYCRTASICDDKGEVKASTESALVYSGKNNDACIALSGENTTFFLKTIIYCDELTAPQAGISDPTAAPGTAEPEPTGVVETPAPTVEPTDAPTAAPTSAPTAKPAAAEKGSSPVPAIIISAAVVIALIIAVTIILKKKKA